jgi:arginyl-tRNA synthetase
MSNSSLDELAARIRAALAAIAGPESADLDPLVRPTQDPRHGDYQTNAALAHARQLGIPPRELAERLVAAADLADICEVPEIAGPGFINFRLRSDYLARQLEGMQADPRLGIPPAAQPLRVVVDFSSPNLAKEMHVGHLRSTIIGDAIARLLEFQGHAVLRLNHLGDWGTQFGMLIEHVRETRPGGIGPPDQFRIDDLEAFYVEAKGRFDQDEEFARAARRAVVDLQSGDPTALALWGEFRRESLRHCHEIYARLGVRIVDRGESYYNERLPGLVEDLLQRGTAVVDQGAVCLFLPGFTGRDETPLPMIVRKTDGAFNYDTTDLAALRQRIVEEKAQRIVYVTDLRQRQHFEMLFVAARVAGWVPPEVQLDHVGFGMVLGADRRPFRTREGDTIKLSRLLDEAEARALAVITDDDARRRVFSREQREEIARAVGLGAVKYFDLKHNVSTDYTFDWDTMLSLDGNTAPYMLYAYARIRSIARRAGIHFEDLPADLPIRLQHPSEVALAKQLLQFGSVLHQATADLRPHHLTEYLYDLSRAFSTFYDRIRGVRVLNAESEELRQSRLRLCDLTARTLQVGLSLLGIEVVEQM